MTLIYWADDGSWGDADGIMLIDISGKYKPDDDDWSLEHLEGTKCLRFDARKGCLIQHIASVD